MKTKLVERLVEVDAFLPFPPTDFKKQFKKDKNKIASEFERVGVTGKKSFRSIGEGQSAIDDILQKYGYIVDLEISSGSSGTARAEVKRRSVNTTVPMGSYLVFSWHLHNPTDDAPKSYEITAYLS